MSRKWTAEEDAKLRKLYPHASTPTLIDKIGRPLPGIYRRANILGIKKTPEYIAKKKAREIADLLRSGVAHRFPKGHVSANKGLRCPGWAPGRMRETQFKKGGISANAMPLWSFRWVDGYLALKTGKRGPKPMDGWEYVHKLIWEQANGPLPDWRVARIWWKDGDHSNCSLSNLELVPGRAHVMRTSVQNLPAPLKQVIQLAGALKRKIRNREEKLHGKEHLDGSAGSPVRNAGIAV